MKYWVRSNTYTGQVRNQPVQTRSMTLLKVRSWWSSAFGRANCSSAWAGGNFQGKLPVCPRNRSLVWRLSPACHSVRDQPKIRARFSIRLSTASVSVSIAGATEHDLLLAAVPVDSGPLQTCCSSSLPCKKSASHHNETLPVSFSPVWRQGEFLVKYSN